MKTVTSILAVLLLAISFLESATSAPAADQPKTACSARAEDQSETAWQAHIRELRHRRHELE